MPQRERLKTGEFPIRVISFATRMVILSSTTGHTIRLLIGREGRLRPVTFVGLLMIQRVGRDDVQNVSDRDQRLEAVSMCRLCDLRQFLSRARRDDEQARSFLRDAIFLTLNLPPSDTVTDIDEDIDQSREPFSVSAYESFSLFNSDDTWSDGLK